MTEAETSGVVVSGTFVLLGGVVGVVGTVGWGERWTGGWGTEVVASVATTTGPIVVAPIVTVMLLVPSARRTMRTTARSSPAPPGAAVGVAGGIGSSLLDGAGRAVLVAVSRGAGSRVGATVGRGLDVSSVGGDELAVVPWSLPGSVDWAGLLSGPAGVLMVSGDGDDDGAACGGGSGEVSCGVPGAAVEGRSAPGV